MAQVTCARCDSVGEGLAVAPLPGEIGRRILARTCEPCWNAWRVAQVVVMNENRLSPANPEHYERIVGEMTRFLGLGDV